MGFFKVLGGVALGVGAVAAAPFTGGGSLIGAATLAGSLAGAGTVAAAVGAGAAGAAAGYALSEKEEEERRRERAQAAKAGEKIADDKWQPQVAEAVFKKNEVEKENKKLLTETKEYREFGEKLVGMFAVGIAVALADGTISPQEEDEISELISGMDAAHYPKEIISEIEALERNPLSFEEALDKAYACGVSKEEMDDIITQVANADGIIEPEEERFIATWQAKAVHWVN